MLSRMSNRIAKTMFRACAALFAASVVLAAIRTTAQQPFPKPLRGEDVDPEFQLEDPQGDWVRPIGEVGTWIASTDGEGGIPFDHAAGYFNREPVIEGAAMASRPWLAFSYCWTAPSICHRPLYFEEPNLERYGHSAGCLLQPAISGAHFFTNLAVLPYKMGQDRCHECVYTLGHYRPGSCAPWQTPDCRVEPDAIFFEGLAVSGIVLLIP